MKRLILFFATLTLSAQTYDIVIANGRVMDPESGLDAVRNIGIQGKRIAVITDRPLTGTTTIDARGMIVAPGFIDLHSHGQDDENYRYKARDGVTTALEMEVGVSPVAQWYASRDGKALVNFGATVGHIPARMAVMKDTGTFLPRDAAAHRKATSEEKRETEELLRRGLAEGALGIGIGIAYVPRATHPEILDLLRIAADRKVAVFVHMRSPGALEPGSVTESIQEMIAGAAVTGAPVHIVHITSMALGQTGLALDMLAGARKRGLDVTTEAYPYTAGQTDVSSAVFDEGWQEKLGITYKDLQWVATGERLTAESFARYRKQGGSTILHAIPEEAARQAVANPDVMIASDGLMAQGRGHPRAAGTYARVLGHYARDQKAVPLMTAIRKMTLLPAKRLEAVSPQMRLKGRIKVGADADLAVFDAARVIDKATFDKPDQYSEGIAHVLVNGVAVVRDGKLVEGVKPGVAIKGRTQ
ncbi:MAG TPA: amidohydrolase family protein [Bryobacteraceae bacterium]|jgi:dihydroorotase|nr:amidohydrolase family protein [Bryobacteraceae bacterium]